ncbi:MAG: glucose-1-phosphate thymidylyltransferase RfbA, partial [Alphaproteobacteria bacterium]|nr:glucose-1-phosphate thymidylyltransferase RfbA [Alphaproteobacteria bacterium]
MTTKKGIILAGGSGTRLYPATKAVSKQLMPVHDKPMIYYPLSTLMLSGIRDFLIISTPRDLPLFEGLLGDGSQWGINLNYTMQAAPNGLAEAFILGAPFVGRDSVAMILGDNLYYGQGLNVLLPEVAQKEKGATTFAYRVANPEQYGVIAYNDQGVPVDVVEKPPVAPSKWAVTGLYFYDNQVVDIAKSLKPSARGELEITDLNRVYLKKNEMEVMRLGRGYTWLDTGTHESLASASDFVRILEQRQGLKLGCPEEIAFANGYIDAEQVLKIAGQMGKTPYAAYLRDL